MTLEEKPLTPLRVTAELTIVKFIGEPYVAYTKYGYAPFLICEDMYSGKQYTLKIQASSLADQLEERRLKTKTKKFDDMIISLRRADNTQKAPYIVGDVD
jgi:hypothetical protein